MKVIYLNCDEGINKREIIAAALKAACINFDGLSFINYYLVFKNKRKLLLKMNYRSIKCIVFGRRKYFKASLGLSLY